MASTSTKRLWWAPWVCQKQGKFPWIEILGKRTPVNPMTMDAWKAFSAVLQAKGYIAQSVWNYNCRQITGGSKYSLHAYGIATDVDPRLNPFLRTSSFSWGKTVFTKEQVDAVLGIKTLTGKTVFMWGGYWSTIKDYMHWEVDVSPKDLDPVLGGGIDWSTVDGEVEVEMTLKRGASGPAVKVYQDALLAWDPNALPNWGADSDYGAETEQAVKNYQMAAELPDTGEIDGVTAGLLSRYVTVGGSGGEQGPQGPPGPPGPAGKTPTVLHATEWQ